MNSNWKQVIEAIRDAKASSKPGKTEEEVLSTCRRCACKIKFVNGKYSNETGEEVNDCDHAPMFSYS